MFRRVLLGRQLRHRHYKFPAEAKKDIWKVLKVYTDLHVKEGAYIVDGIVNFSNLLYLSGTIPVICKGSSYNLPISIWLLHGHPHQVPKVYVNRPTPMEINLNNYVDDIGRVHTPYLTEWSEESKSNLIPLVEHLQIIFGDVSTLGNLSSQSQYQPLHMGALFKDTSTHKQYKEPLVVMSHIIRALGRYKSFELKVQLYTTDHGETPRWLFCLEGTIPVTCGENVVANIPIMIWVLPSYPKQEPLVYVNPDNNMKVTANKNIDCKGRVMTTYLREWCRNSEADIHSLLEVLRITFTEVLPEIT